METLRSLLGSTTDSFQSISESLRDLPQQILRKTGGTVDGPTHRRGRTWGDHRFHFSLHFEPRSEGGGLCQTGVLVATASMKSDGREPLALTCHWRRRVGAHLIQIPGIQSNMYHTSADDIGMEIVCQAEPAGASGLGQAFGALGPFELDPITRMSLENLVASGGSRFPVRHYRAPEDPHPRDLQIHVTQDYVKVVHPGAERGVSEVSAPYSADYPKVVIHPVETCKFRLELSDDQDKIYHFVALSRTSRDLIALLIRGFHSRIYVATSFVLSRLYQNPATPGAPLTSVQHDNFDIVGLSDRLGRELERTVGQLEAVERVVRNATEEKRQLQAQLRETISSYTEAIEQLHQQLAVSKGGPAAALQLQLHDGRAVHSRLQLEAQELRQRLEDEKQRAPKGSAADGAVAEGAAAADALRAEIAQLRASISALAGDAAQHSQRDITRAEELRRLRADVEALMREKEGLERCTAQAEKEKDDLIENFLYVKGCLDKVQMACIQTPAVSPEVERQLGVLKAHYSQVVDDRNRVAVRVEALERDREKQKHGRESGLERVMTANARLLEERDRLEKERTRVSELYKRTMSAMGVQQVEAPSVSAGAQAADQAAFEALRAELSHKAAQLAKREQEGESLRARLRKLALV